MREIKFRVWDRNKEKMAAVTEIRFSEVQYTLIKYRMIDECGKAIDEWSHVGGEDGCDIAILMQYTNLKDKNGREIYEGDIVRHATDEGVYKVIFEDGGFFVENIFEYDYQRINEYPLEIIGNIYENPELLGDTQ